MTAKRKFYLTKHYYLTITELPDNTILLIFIFCQCLGLTLKCCMLYLLWNTHNVYNIHDVASIGVYLCML